MNTNEINEYLNYKNSSKIFKGVFACDQLPEKFSLPAAFIINLSKKSEGGSHWVAMYFDRNSQSYFFDSFGLRPKNKYILNFIKSHSKKTQFNKIQLQHITSTKCGKFCCVFIAAILLNKTIKAFIKKFSNNLYINEIIVERLYTYFGKNK